MATGTVKRPPADRRRPRGREALATHPPAPVDDTTSGSREQRPEGTSAPATRVPQEAADLISSDIDMLLRGRNTLIDLLQDNDRNIVDRLGGTPEAVAAGHVKIAFEHGLLHISTFRPDPPCGGAVATVDGQLEKVLSSRARRRRHRLPPTGRVHRERLARSPPRCSPTIPTTRSAAPAGSVGARLGPEAAAFHAHRYTCLEIDLHGDTLSIRKAIGAGPLEPETTPPASPAEHSSSPAWPPTSTTTAPSPHPSPRRHPGCRQRRRRTHDPRLRESIEHRHARPARPSRSPTATADRDRTGASPHPQQRPRVRPLTPPHASNGSPRLGLHRSTLWLTPPSARPMVP